MSQNNGSAQTQLTVRRARLSDVAQMMPVLNEYARQAEILPRLEAEVYQSIRDWVVAEAGGQVVGMGSLVILWHDLAEIRSLVIEPAHHGLGLGRQIVTQLLVEAQTLALPRIFALTRKPGFFLKLGFQLTRMEDLPRKVQKDCVFCPKFKACDEVAVIMPLSPGLNIESVIASAAHRNGRPSQPVASSLHR
ncbi:MAG: N-acetyltransferase [Chloroflexota bacterium]